MQSHPSEVNAQAFKDLSEGLRYTVFHSRSLRSITWQHQVGNAEEIQVCVISYPSSNKRSYSRHVPGIADLSRDLKIHRSSQEVFGIHHVARLPSSAIHQHSEASACGFQGVLTPLWISGHASLPSWSLESSSTAHRGGAHWEDTGVQPS